MVEAIVHHGKDIFEYVEWLLDDGCLNWTQDELGLLFYAASEFAMLRFGDLIETDNGRVDEANFDLAEKCVDLSASLDRLATTLVLSSLERAWDPALVHLSHDTLH